MHRPTFTLSFLVLLAVFGLYACAPRTPPPARVPAVEAPVPAAPPPIEIVEAPTPDPGTIVPVTANDPIWGDALAPVTWVMWGDYECQFTAKLFLRLDSFMSVYGPRQLRIVWRHNPLPFHESARPLAIAAETIFRLGGARAFWFFSHRLFANQGSVDAKSLVQWAAEAGVDPMAFATDFAAETYAAKVAEDIALGKKVGVTGTPASLLNGVFVSGAQRDEKFVAVIDAQIGAARELVAGGLPREKVYAAAVERNYKEQPPAKKVEVDSVTVWKVPVGKSAVRGKATALVTLVMFGDFECQFCAKVQPTLAALEQAYGDKLRLVFKHNPLPFHPRAEPAAQLAIEARAQGGDAKFWEAHDLLYKNQKSLTDQDLDAHATALGLSPKRIAAAVASHKHTAVIEADGDLANDLQAHGTPHFFINGRRLIGSQPVDKFKSIIDEEIAKAQKLVAAGTPLEKVYEALQKDGREHPAPERIVVPAATAANPAKGAKAGAKVVTVQMFVSLQCRFCKQVQATMDELIAAFPGKVRVVFRHLPLAIHKDSGLAAEASVEAFKQKGNDGFWAFTKLVFEDQSAMGKESLVKKAKAAGLDADKMRAALDAGTHRAAVEADSKLAERLSITGTPAFAIDDYFVSGAQSLGAFKRAVRRALGPRVPPAPENLHGAPKPSAPAKAEDGAAGTKAE